jgi:hypothetical protein
MCRLREAGGADKDGRALDSSVPVLWISDAPEFSGPVRTRHEADGEGGENLKVERLDNWDTKPVTLLLTAENAHVIKRTQEILEDYVRRKNVVRITEEKRAEDMLRNAVMGHCRCTILEQPIEERPTEIPGRPIKKIKLEGK